MPSQENRNLPGPGKTVSLVRALSKLGFCSRHQAQHYILAGRVTVNGTVQTQPSIRIYLYDRIDVDGRQIQVKNKVYLMLNKPRGLVTTCADERGRDTVFSCLNDPTLPRVVPVGRLDKASEGLLLFTNDTHWADLITTPATHLDKTYHVQVDRLIDEVFCQKMMAGVITGTNAALAVKKARKLRRGRRNSWLEIILAEGKNRQIRRILQALNVNVLRLVRVAVGPVKLGTLPKGQYRHLTSEEIQQLAPVQQARIQPQR